MGRQKCIIRYNGKRIPCIIGANFGKLFVINQYHKFNGKQNVIWFTCKCMCGNIKEIIGQSLLRGITQSCGCFSKISYINERFDRLLVIEQYLKDGKSWGICKCDCGIIKHVCINNLVTQHTKSCGCFKKEQSSLPNGEAAFNRVFYNYKKEAEMRNYVFELTKEQFQFLTSQNCVECGIEPSNIHDIECNGDFTYQGIDRRDNKIGYIFNNCVPCCITCNRAKLNQTLEEWQEYKRRFVNYNANLINNRSSKVTSTTS